MEPLYNLNDSPRLEPKVYKMSDGVDYLFPVLKDGTQYAATNSLGNGITLLTFEADKVKQDKYFRKLFSGITMDLEPKVMKPIEDGVFGFGQVRTFVLFDMKKRKMKEYDISPSISETILQVDTADAKKRYFVFSVDAYPKKSNSAWNSTSVIRLYDLSGDEAKLIKEVEKSKNQVWELQDNKLFLFGSPEFGMKVFTPQLEPSNHPLVDVYNQHKGQLHISDIQLHPTLPVALVMDAKKPACILTWGERKRVNLAPIIDDFNWPKISPDGKWVVFTAGGSMNPMVYLMPISEKYPYYIGTPILLFTNKLYKYTSTWATNPTSFVGAFDGNLYRWELTKEAQKSMMGSDFDKYPTFHDWIVEKDLEKLTKEKKQGLGK